MSNISYSAQNTLEIDPLTGAFSGYDSLTEFAISDIEDDFNKKKDTEEALLARTYMRFHDRFGWSYTEFVQVPIEILDALSEEMTAEIEKLNDKDYVMSRHYLETLLAIVHALNGRK